MQPTAPYRRAYVAALHQIMHDVMSQAPFPSEFPRASIVVPVLNARSTLDRCLDSLAALRGNDLFEIIVVDNGSTDGSRDIAAARRNVMVLEQPHKGAARARNMGWRHGRAKFIAFIDSDCVADPNWLSDLLPELESDPGIGGLGGEIATGNPGELIPDYIDFRCLFRAEHMIRDQPCSPPFLMTANAVYRREAIQAVGGFNESLWPHEDADLAWRIGWAGWRLAQVPGKGIVRHYHRGTIRSLARMMHTYGYGGADLFALHRARLGRKAWIDWISYWRLFKALVKIPYRAVTARTPMMRRSGVYDTVTYSCFIAGRWRAAFKNKVLTL